MLYDEVREQKRRTVCGRVADLVYPDDNGHWYFLDRLGDTFRWKSENVSTAEVAEVFGRFPGIAEANVYGVTVPGHEGRAGCAALHLTIAPTEAFFTDLLQYSRTNLPRYAIPVFLRIVKNSSHIHNHKQNKVGLRQEGVDPKLIGSIEKDGKNDAFMWWNPASDTYVPFAESTWSSLSRGEVKL